MIYAHTGHNSQIQATRAINEQIMSNIWTLEHKGKTTNRHHKWISTTTTNAIQRHQLPVMDIDRTWRALIKQPAIHIHNKLFTMLSKSVPPP